MNLIHGDCIEEMAKMGANSVDLTVTSPPYDNLRTYDGSLQWSEDIWKQVLEGLYRVTKEGGVVVWVVGDATIKGSETGTSFKQALYAMECGFNLHDTMIWNKSNPVPGDGKHRYHAAFEYMLVLSVGSPASRNLLRDIPNASFGKNWQPSGDRRTKDNLSRPKGTTWECPEYGFRTNVWKSPNASGARSLHPAVFPEAIAHDHIISWSNEGDTVFDPFLGSGTTGLAAKQLNRNFIGIEKVEKYYDIAQERLGNIQPTLI